MAGSFEKFWGSRTACRSGRVPPRDCEKVCLMTRETRARLSDSEERGKGGRSETSTGLPRAPSSGPNSSLNGLFWSTLLAPCNAEFPRPDPQSCFTCNPPEAQDQLCIGRMFLAPAQSSGISGLSPQFKDIGRKKLVFQEWAGWTCSDPDHESARHMACFSHTKERGAYGKYAHIVGEGWALEPEGKWQSLEKVALFGPGLVLAQFLPGHLWPPCLWSFGSNRQNGLRQGPCLKSASLSGTILLERNSRSCSATHPPPPTTDIPVFLCF